MPATRTGSLPSSFLPGSCGSTCPGATERSTRWSRDFVRGGPPRARLGEIHRLTAAQEQGIAHLLHPPVLQGARSLWYQGKVLEIMAEFFFERRGEDELFCDRQKRLARERVDRVMALLAAASRRAAQFGGNRT